MLLTALCIRYVLLTDGMAVKNLLPSRDFKNVIPSLYSILLSHMPRMGEHCITAHCTVCAIKSKNQDESHRNVFSLQEKKSPWFSTADIFSFAVQMKTCLWISSFVFLMRTTVKRAVDSYQLAQHSSSVMYNIFNRRGPWNITTTRTMIHPVSFTYWFNAEACSEV